MSDPIGYQRRQSRANGISIGEPILQYPLRGTFGNQAGRYVKHKEVHEVLQIETKLPGTRKTAVRRCPRCAGFSFSSWPGTSTGPPEGYSTVRPATQAVLLAIRSTPDHSSTEPPCRMRGKPTAFPEGRSVPTGRSAPPPLRSTAVPGLLNRT